MRLPLELCEAVLSCFQPQEDGIVENINLSTLARCALVSRKFHLLARPRIFANIHIEDDIGMKASHKLKLIKEAFELDNYLSTFVRSFTLEILEDDELLSHRPHAQSLYNDPSLSFLLSEFKFLEFLSIRSVTVTASTRVTQWYELGPTLQDAFRHLFRTNGRHLKTLCLRKLCLPPDIWITELKSLSTLILDSCPLYWPNESIEDVAPRSASPDNKPTSPSKIHLSYLSPQYLKVLINGPNSEMFRQSKDATITLSHHWQSSPELLTGLLSAMSQTLTSLDLTLKVAHLDQSLNTLPLFPSLTTLHIRLRYQFDIYTNLLSTLLVQLLPLCSLFLRKCPNMTSLSVSVAGACGSWFDVTPVESFLPSFLEIDKTLAPGICSRSRKPCFYVAVKLVRVCPDEDVCEKCETFYAFEVPSDLRAIFPRLGEIEGVQLDCAVVRLVEN